MNETGLGKLSPEGVYQGDDFVAELLDDVDDWLFVQPKIVERYLNGGLSCHLHIRLWGTEVDTRDFCALFGGPLGGRRRIDPDNRYRVTLRPRSRAIADNEFSGVRERDDKRQETMFFGVIHLAEQIQEIPLDVFALVVRLTPLNQRSCGSGDALYASALTGRFEFLRRVTDWELMASFDGLPIGNDELAEQMIQARPQLMDDFPGDNSPAHRRLWPHDVYAGLSRISLDLTDRTVDIAIDQVTDFRIEVLDVLIGPLNRGGQ